MQPIDLLILVFLNKFQIPDKKMDFQILSHFEEFVAQNWSYNESNKNPNSTRN